MPEKNQVDIYSQQECLSILYFLIGTYHHDTIIECTAFHAKQEKISECQTGGNSASDMRGT